MSNLILYAIVYIICQIVIIILNKAKTAHPKNNKTPFLLFLFYENLYPSRHLYKYKPIFF